MLNLDFTSKKSLIEAFFSEQKCIDYLEVLRWNDVIVSPFDNSSTVYFCKKNTYKCKNSGKYFNVKTRTLFHNTKIELQKWFIAIWIISSQKSKINSVALSIELEITQKSAWYMIQRIKLYRKNNDDTFEKKNNQSFVKKAKVSTKVAKIEVVEENEKLSLLQWLQTLKK